MDHVSTNIDRSRSPFIIPLAILAVLATIGGLATLLALRHGGGASAGSSGDAVPVVRELGPTTFVNAGPLPVGERTVLLPGSKVPVELWYPANPDSYHGSQATYNVEDWLPAALKPLFKNVKPVRYPSGGIRGAEVHSGRFPVVLFSHGYSGWRSQSTFLTAHLASWGFVVASPEHASRDLTEVLSSLGKSSTPASGADVNDLRSTLDYLAAQNDADGSYLKGHLDLSRVAAVGHSAGGAAVEKLAVVDSRIKTFIGLAGAAYGSFGSTATGAGSEAPKVPGMIEFGLNDHIVKGASLVNAYNLMHSPKRLITLSGQGHLVFADICQIAPGRGGLLGLAKEAGLPIPEQLKGLGSDGCLPPDVAVTTAWPVIKQSVTAQLRWTLGLDENQSGLQGLASTYSGIVDTNTTASSADATTVLAGAQG
jgi:dienelactone hydrolase